MGMGNPLLDITANVDEEFLQQYGVKLDEAILADPEKHKSLYTDMISKYDVQYIAGGATQNTMRVAQWMLSGNKIGLPSNSVAFMGCVGTDDEYGTQLEKCATSDGVFVHYMKAPNDIPTGTCAALIVGGERALVANLAAANSFHPSHLQTTIAQDIIASSKIYYSAGFFLTVSPESLLQVAEQFSQNPEKIVALNLSAPFIIEFFKDPLAKALEYADYLFGNESEAETYAKVNGLPTDDLKAVAQAVAAMPCKGSSGSRTVVFTQGSKATIVATATTVTEYPVQLLDKSDLVDTNGAGDAFVGGFLAQLSQGQPISTCVEAGHFAARYIIQVSGTSLPTPCTFGQ
jgi:adenosine kinase